jgi:hypothetical protein
MPCSGRFHEGYDCECRRAQPARPRSGISTAARRDAFSGQARPVRRPAPCYKRKPHASHNGGACSGIDFPQEFSVYAQEPASAEEKQK